MVPSNDCEILFKAVCFLLVLFTIGILAFCISISYQILYPNYEPTNGNESDDWIDVGEYGLAKSKHRIGKSSPPTSEISTTSKSDRFLVQHVLWSKILIICMLKTEKIQVKFEKVYWTVRSRDFKNARFKNWSIFNELDHICPEINLC